MYKYPITVVIPTYNRCDVLERVLESLFMQYNNPVQFEIVVIDDCSDDKTQIRISAIKYDFFKYLRHDKNRGRVSARNFGIKSSSGRLIVFLDDDNIPSPNLIESYFNSMNIFGESTAYVGAPSYPAKIAQRSNMVRYLDSRYIWKSLSNTGALVRSKNFGTLNCAVLKSDLVKVGMFDPDFRYYGGEDEYLGYLLESNGVKIVCVKEARTEHLDKVSVSRMRLKMQEYGYYGCNLLKEKAPNYFDQTSYSFFIKHTSPIFKVFYNLVAKTIGAPFLYYLTISDRYKIIYSPTLIRVGLFVWLVEGLTNKSHTKHVNY